EFPVLLEHEAPCLQAYRPETAIAEKLHVLVDLGMANSRMKDFFDLRFLARNFDFGGEDLTRAIVATFDRRATPVPRSCPTALSPEFAADELKATQWRAFLRRSRLLPQECSLGETVAAARELLLPLLTALADGRAFEETWLAGGPWREDRRPLSRPDC
ncbi:MAG: nucleotidyl transferase AbiEii/AbiGii toxin family protein, partial [Planctomycetota bacterium]